MSKEINLSAYRNKDLYLRGVKSSPVHETVRAISRYNFEPVTDVELETQAESETAAEQPQPVAKRSEKPASHPIFNPESAHATISSFANSGGD